MFISGSFDDFFMESFFYHCAKNRPFARVIKTVWNESIFVIFDHSSIRGDDNDGKRDLASWRPAGSSWLCFPSSFADLRHFPLDYHQFWDTQSHFASFQNTKFMKKVFSGRLLLWNVYQISSFIDSGILNAWIKRIFTSSTKKNPSLSVKVLKSFLHLKRVSKSSIDDKLVKICIETQNAKIMRSVSQASIQEINGFYLNSHHFCMPIIRHFLCKATVERILNFWDIPMLYTSSVYVLGAYLMLSLSNKLYLKYQANYLFLDAYNH